MRAMTRDPTPDPVGSVRRLLDDAGAALTHRCVLALCSGGADSVALVHLLGGLPRGAAPRRVDVLFLDHAVRGDVDAERNAARAAAEAVGATFHERRCEQDLRSGDGGMEAAARAWRYASATEVARALGCDVVATGHTGDDQVELALLSVLGITGDGTLAAMPVQRPIDADSGIQLVRPLLGLTRAQVEQVCVAAGARWSDDPSNQDADAHRRNAIRARVVPPLVAIEPTAGAALAHGADRARSERASTSGLADALLTAWADVPDVGGASTLDVRRVAALDADARRALLAQWLRRAGLGRALSGRAIRAVDGLVVRAQDASIDLGGGACVRRAGYDLQIHRPHHGGSQP